MECMSSPFSPETKPGTEETIEALDRLVDWAARIDAKNHDVDVNVEKLIDDALNSERKVRRRYRVKKTEMEIDNFVWNHPSLVEDILVGSESERADALESIDEYVSAKFGYVNPLSLDGGRYVWLVAQEVFQHQSSPNSIDVYSESPFDEIDLEDMGTVPEYWVEGYPKYS